MSTSRHIRLSITRQPTMEADVNLENVSIRERLMRFLFGPMKDLTLIVPGHDVDGVTITRAACEPADDLSDDELDALAASMTRHPSKRSRALVGGEGK